MAVDSSKLKAQLTQKAQKSENGVETAVAERKPADTFEALLLKYQGNFMQALPKAVGFERFMRTALTTIRNNPQLKQCDAVSVMAALMTSAQLGLEVGPLGHAYLVPFRDKKSGKTLAQFIVGYRGMLELARRSGEIESVMVEPIHENDEFEYELGLNPTIKHKPALTNRGKRLGYYGVVRFRNGGYQLKVMSMDEIYAHKARSKAANAGPWVTDEDAMCRKTVFRAMWKWLPMAVEHMETVETADETVRMDVEAEPEFPTVDAEYSVYDGGTDNDSAEQTKLV